MQGLSETWMYTVLFLLVMVGRRAVTTLWQVCACRGQEHRRRSFLAAFIAKLVAKYFMLRIYALRARPDHSALDTFRVCHTAYAC